MFDLKSDIPTCIEDLCTTKDNNSKTSPPAAAAALKVFRIS
jgi:hypothetical protein